MCVGLRSYFTALTKWSITWGDGKTVPVITDALIVSAPLYIPWRRRTEPLAGSAHSPGQPPQIVVGAENYLSACYDAGCDYYIKDPWKPEELLCVLRRCVRTEIAAWVGHKRLVVGQTTLDVGENRVAINNQEYKILKLLVRNPNCAVNREELCTALVGMRAGARLGLTVRSRLGTGARYFPEEKIAVRGGEAPTSPMAIGAESHGPESAALSDGQLVFSPAGTPTRKPLGAGTVPAVTRTPNSNTENRGIMHTAKTLELLCVHIHYLRKKLAKLIPEIPSKKIIQTVACVGYMFCDDAGRVQKEHS